MLTIEEKKEFLIAKNHDIDGLSDEDIEYYYTSETTPLEQKIEKLISLDFPVDDMHLSTIHNMFLRALVFKMTPNYLYGIAKSDDSELIQGEAGKR